ncbi:hypothetical protein PS880_06311 [Pseudomonas fluorescens]|uniref:Uncharacterized protein n=1 Tax=Pseudomonas fluorescens TaxID=294 RepID=A0A5E7QHD0_PSEFL|nr:hypothetical protein PS880_06311 [Pseudomonas fluorescens]
MPQHGLDKTDIRAVFQHQGGHGVAEQMAAAAFANLGGIDMLTDHLAHVIGVEHLALPGQKQGAIVLGQRILGADIVTVFFDPSQGPFTDGNHPVFFTFTLTNHHRAAFVVDAAPAQPNEFHAAHAGAVQGFQHGPITNPHKRVDVRHVEDFFGFITAENVFWQAPFDSR